VWKRARSDSTNKSAVRVYILKSFLMIQILFGMLVALKVHAQEAALCARAVEMVCVARERIIAIASRIVPKQAVIVMRILTAV